MLTLDAQGRVRQALQIASPNQDQRPPDMAIELVVIHNISLPPGHFGGDGVIELFTNRLDPAAHAYYQQIHSLKVSAHFFIRRSGELVQLVPCSQRAWHAGVSNWRGRECCNDFSIGIELEGDDATPFEAAQYATLNALLSALKRKYPIADVRGHCDIAPQRKTDPGPCFDWAKITP